VLQEKNNHPQACWPWGGYFLSLLSVIARINIENAMHKDKASYTLM
jgi:hypothetical protein